jgi:signal transduction histidine kinase
MNLIINAGQSIKNKGNIIITTSFAGKKALIKIEDTGAGIKPDVINKIFDPFFTTKPTGQGTGLGLSVSYGIIKEHNGDITVKSRPEQGSLFLIELPLSVRSKKKGNRIADEI